MGSKVILNREQELALEKILVEKRNVFVSGAGGTGKSTIINEIRCKLKNVVVCAPTGMAAMNVCGETLHSTFKLPCRALGPNENIEAMLNKVITNAQIIILDEISMVRSDCFSTIIRIIRCAEEKTNRKIQIVVFGDFYQIPPVITTNDRTVISEAWSRETQHGFCFETKEWKQCNFDFVELKKNVRQNNDDAYEYNLNLLREGNAECIEYFNRETSKHMLDGVTLCGRKADVDTINRTEAEKLPGAFVQYTAICEGGFPQNKKMTEDKLLLKVGMRVMTVCNDVDKQYRNGSIGTITKLLDESVVVKFDKGNMATVVPYTWKACKSKCEEGKIVEDYLGSWTQLPIRVAYASTIHKAQGMTLDSVNISPDVFEAGMLYVAMGRCHSVKDIHLLEPIDESAVMASPKVKEFYESLREM